MYKHKYLKYKKKYLELRKQQHGGMDLLGKAAAKAKELAGNSQNFDGLNIVFEIVEIDSTMLRELSDDIQLILNDSIIILGSKSDKGPVIIVKLTKFAIEKGFDARDIVRNISKIIEGKGGGKPDMAQAGGNDKTCGNDEQLHWSI